MSSSGPLPVTFDRGNTYTVHGPARNSREVKEWPHCLHQNRTSFSENPTTPAMPIYDVQHIVNCGKRYRALS
jgi:hypothetical protein